ncbi:COG4315 family predicted lipoprotein [Kribbella sp. CWNU-51]
MITDRNSETNHRRHLQIAATSFAAAVFALAAAACGSAPGDSAGSDPMPSATGDAVSAQPTALGTILVDGQGRTLYQFANDMTNKSTCADACAANWLYAPAPDSLPTSLPGVTGTLATTTRDDGHHQLSVAGHPLYTFVGDSTPGQTNGQGINLNGGVWTVVSPAGAPLTNPSPAGAQSPALPGY